MHGEEIKRLSTLNSKLRKHHPNGVSGGPPSRGKSKQAQQPTDLESVACSVVTAKVDNTTTPPVINLNQGPVDVKASFSRKAEDRGAIRIRPRAVNVRRAKGFRDLNEESSVEWNSRNSESSETSKASAFVFSDSNPKVFPSQERVTRCDIGLPSTAQSLELDEKVKRAAARYRPAPSKNRTIPVRTSFSDRSISIQSADANMQSRGSTTRPRAVGGRRKPRTSSDAMSVDSQNSRNSKLEEIRERTAGLSPSLDAAKPTISPEHKSSALNLAPLETRSNRDAEAIEPKSSSCSVSSEASDGQPATTLSTADILNSSAAAGGIDSSISILISALRSQIVELQDDQQNNPTSDSYKICNTILEQLEQSHVSEVQNLGNQIEKWQKLYVDEVKSNHKPFKQKSKVTPSDEADVC